MINSLVVYFFLTNNIYILYRKFNKLIHALVAIYWEKKPIKMENVFHFRLWTLNCFGKLLFKFSIFMDFPVYYNTVYIHMYLILFMFQVVNLNWWPLCRDCLFYTVSVAALAVVIMDEQVFWYVLKIHQNFVRIKQQQQN